MQTIKIIKKTFVLLEIAKKLNGYLLTKKIRHKHLINVRL